MNTRQKNIEQITAKLLEEHLSERGTNFHQYAYQLKDLISQEEFQRISDILALLPAVENMPLTILALANEVLALRSILKTYGLYETKRVKRFGEMLNEQ